MFREFDRKLIAATERLPERAHPLMTAFSFIGSPPFMAIVFIATVSVTYFRKAHDLLRAELFLLLALPIAAVLKLITRRVRPDTLYVHDMRFKTYSFPSGHAYTSILILGFLAYLAARHWPQPWGLATAVLLSLLIFFIGVSRVYLGAHFPTDVLGGWLLGVLALWLIIRFAVRA